MKRQLSDEQLDNLMQTLVNDASADDATINEIADSPTVWWGVLRQINAQKETSHSPWPPISKVWRWLMIGLPAAAAVFLVSFFVLRPADTSGNQANNIVTPVKSNVEELPAAATKLYTIDEPKIAKREKRQAVTKQANARPTTAAIAAKAAEIKTDFIALSYARNPESGQIVRVKVPSSMMVTLGLVATVEKPSSLVDAEVIIGDDGLTRAIRFIH